jgi:hypothetical protein
MPNDGTTTQLSLRPTFCIVISVYNVSTDTTADDTVALPEDIAYNVRVTTSSDVIDFERVQRSHEPPIAQGSGYKIQSARAGQICGVAWIAEEAYFVFYESIPDPEECTP